jgi:hypothetical protein
MLTLCGQPPVERRVGSTPQQRGCVVDKRGMHAIRRIQRRHQVPGWHSWWPADAQAGGDTSERIDRTRLRWRQRANYTDTAIEHQLRCNHAGKQRNLGVGVLDRQRCPEGSATNYSRRL